MIPQLQCTKCQKQVCTPMMNERVVNLQRLLTPLLSHSDKCIFLQVRKFNSRRIFRSVFISGRQSAKKLANCVNHGFQKAYILFAIQCNVIAGQRVWRFFKILSWYRLIYGETILLQNLRYSFSRCINSKNLCVLLSAASVFQFEEDGITYEEMISALCEMEALERLMDKSRSQNGEHINTHDCWEIVIDKKSFKVWRRYIKEYGLFEYRVYGTFDDITPMAFYNTQMDVKFWSYWDKQTLDIDIIETDAGSNSEVIHWVYKYPVDHERQRVVIRAKSVIHPKCREVDSVVRVRHYQSLMVIEPHHALDENGFSFYMTYFDDPQTRFPHVCYNWLASTGVPGFVEQLHSAAKVMQERTERGYCPNPVASSLPPSDARQPHNDTILPNMRPQYW